MSKTNNKLLSNLTLTKFKKYWPEVYLDMHIEDYEKALEKNPGDYWNKLGQKKALKLFHLAATGVPAYKDFLKKEKVNGEKIKSIADFSLVPPTDKKNYIQNYPLADRCFGGKLEQSNIVASSSGTSGNPNYWPRGNFQEFEGAITTELLYTKLFEMDRFFTLVIIGFPMGVYVSGMAMASPSFWVMQKYPMTLLTVGNNKAEALKAVKLLSSHHEQTLLIGHPFFIKDVLETGKAEGIDWRKAKIKMLFASEGFSEDWRKFVLNQAGLNSNEVSAFNLYGCAEMLIMACETALSVRIREKLEADESIAQKLFGTPDVPQLFQYNPLLRYAETLNKELLFTAASGLPLIRFNLHDNGRILTQKTIEQEVGSITRPDDWRLPFLTLEGRSDYTVIFYGANIYPQHIHYTLNHRDLLKKLTGKFTMVKRYHKNMDEYLEIHIELKPAANPTKNFEKKLQNLIFENLKKINSEYSDAYFRCGSKAVPRVHLWPYSHDKYFKIGLKPKYILS